MVPCVLDGGAVGHGGVVGEGGGVHGMVDD